MLLRGFLFLSSRDSIAHLWKNICNKKSNTLKSNTARTGSTVVEYWRLGKLGYHILGLFWTELVNTSLIARSHNLKWVEKKKTIRKVV